MESTLCYREKKEKTRRRQAPEKTRERPGKDPGMTRKRPEHREYIETKQ